MLGYFCFDLTFSFFLVRFRALKNLKLIIMDTAFKKILIAFDGSDSSKSALQSAYGVAQKFDSDITALVVSEEDTTRAVISESNF